MTISTTKRATAHHVLVDHGYEMQGGPTGVLLIHGLTGTPAEMRVIAKGLNRVGYTVRVVQLAGHCGSVEDLLATSWRDWYDSVCRAADELAGRCQRLFVGGLSMGALLALKYAADHPERTAGVLAYAPVFAYDGWAMPSYGAIGSWLLPLMKKWNIGRSMYTEESEPFGIKDEALRQMIADKMRSGRSEEAGLSGTPWYALAEFHALVAAVKPQLRRVVSPCLIIHSLEDDVADPRNAKIIAKRVRGKVSILWLGDSYHMITVDRERRRVVGASHAFIDQVASWTSRAAEEQEMGHPRFGCPTPAKRNNAMQPV